MYYEHFGLNQAPFRITPNTDFFFGGGNRGPILEALIYAVTQGEGIVKVTGEVGSGKTMLCNMLQTRLPEQVETVYLANPNVAPEEILHAIAFEMQLAVDRNAGRLAVMHAIQNHLLRRHAEGRRVVLFVEESQGMPLPTLEEIRLLSNLETKADKLLQIVLFGQPELDENLRQNQIRQLKERITHSFRLEPLNAQETREYLMFRLRAAGYRGPDLFTDAVVREIARISGGLTRRINLLADKALLAAFSENTHTLRQKHIDAAVRDSAFAQQRPAPATLPRLAPVLLLLVIGMAAGAGLYAWLGRNGGSAAADTSAAPPAVTDAASPVETSPSRNSENNSIKSNSYIKSATPPAAPSPAALPPSPPPAATVAAAKPAPAPAVAVQSGAPGQSLLEQRLAATQEWLGRSGMQTYTIQLFGAKDEKQLNQHLKNLEKFIEINSIYVYRTTAKGTPMLTVTWGSYESPRAAREAMTQLPSFLKNNNPLLRTTQGIRSEIREHHAAPS